MDFLYQLILLAIGFVFLIKGADFFVDGASGLAKRLGVSQLIIGLTIVAMGTSAPEAAVSITSAFKGESAVAVGNIAGSNILNTLIILGVTACIQKLKMPKSTLRYELPFTFLVTIVFVLCGATGGQISRPEGILLWAFFIIYWIYLLKTARKEAKADKAMARAALQIAMLTAPKKRSNARKRADAKASKSTRHQQSKITVKTQPDTFKSIALVLVGLVIIMAGSNLAVSSATGLAHILGVSERLIGLTIIALGTSLPELVTSIVAARKGDADLAIGNIVGSNIFNILFVIGTSSIIIPTTFDPLFITDGLIAAASLALLFVATIKRKELNRKWALAMLASYVVYFVILLNR